MTLTAPHPPQGSLLGPGMPTALSAPPTCGCGPGRELEEPSPVEVPSRGRGMAEMLCEEGAHVTAHDGAWRWRGRWGF